jgi:hypothetical protein
MAETTAAVGEAIFGATEGAGAATAVAEGAMTVSEAVAAGATASDMAAAGVSVGEMAQAGITAEQMAQAGITAEQMAQAGMTAEQISQAGFTAEQLAQATPYLEQAAAGAESVPFQLADGSMGSIQGGNILDAAGNIVAEGGTGGTSLGDVLGYAKTGAQIIGGISQFMGGQQARQAGKQVGQLQADPYAAYRSQAASQLQNLLMNPSTITTTPGYQFNLQQGLQAQQAQQAAQGRLVSGGGLLQAQQFGQQYATSNLQQQQNLLATLSGANQSPATGATAQGNLIAGQLGGNLGGLQAMATGAQNVLNPLATLYAQYNQPSPTIMN